MFNLSICLNSDILPQVNRTFWSGLGNIFVWLGSWFLNGMANILYTIVKLAMGLIDFMQFLVQKLAGIEIYMNLDKLDLENLKQTDIVFRFLFSDTVVDVLKKVFTVFLVLLIVFTIFAIIKNEYSSAMGGKGDSIDHKKSWIAAGKAILTVLLVPMFLIAGIIGSNAILASIARAFNVSGNLSLGGQIFVASAYDASAYRYYAQQDMRKYTSNTVIFKISDDGKQYSVNSALNAIGPLSYTENKQFSGFMFTHNGEDYYLFACNNDEAEAYYNYIKYILGAYIVENDATRDSSIAQYVKENGYNTSLPDVDSQTVIDAAEEKYSALLSIVDTDDMGANGYFTCALDKQKSSSILIDAAYNTWSYNQILETALSGWNSKNTSLSTTTNSFETLSGKTREAQVVKNSSEWGKLHDGGLNGLAPMAVEYLVMADVMDFVMENGVTLYYVNANNININYEAGEISLDARYKKSSNGRAVNFDGFLVDYKDQGRVAYEIKDGVNDEISGATFIVCYFDSQTNKYIPVINNKKVVDVYGNKYTFKSSQFTDDYQGVVIARGVFKDSDQAQTCEPTYIKSTMVVGTSSTDFDAAQKTAVRFDILGGDISYSYLEKLTNVTKNDINFSVTNANSDCYWDEETQTFTCFVQKTDSGSAVGLSEEGNLEEDENLWLNLIGGDSNTTKNKIADKIISKINNFEMVGTVVTGSDVGMSFYIQNKTATYKEKFGVNCSAPNVLEVSIGGETYYKVSLKLSIDYVSNNVPTLGIAATPSEDSTIKSFGISVSDSNFVISCTTENNSLYSGGTSYAAKEIFNMATLALESFGYKMIGGQSDIKVSDGICVVWGYYVDDTTGKYDNSKVYKFVFNLEELTSKVDGFYNNSATLTIDANAKYVDVQIAGDSLTYDAGKLYLEYNSQNQEKLFYVDKQSNLKSSKLETTATTIATKFVEQMNSSGFVNKELSNVDYNGNLEYSTTTQGSLEVTFDVKFATEDGSGYHLAKVTLTFVSHTMLVADTSANEDNTHKYEFVYNYNIYNTYKAYHDGEQIGEILTIDDLKQKGSEKYWVSTNDQSEAEYVQVVQYSYAYIADNSTTTYTFNGITSSEYLADDGVMFVTGKWESGNGVQFDEIEYNETNIADRLAYSMVKTRLLYLPDYSFIELKLDKNLELFVVDFQNVSADNAYFVYSITFNMEREIDWSDDNIKVYKVTLGEDDKYIRNDSGEVSKAMAKEYLQNCISEVVTYADLHDFQGTSYTEITSGNVSSRRYSATVSTISGEEIIYCSTNAEDNLPNDVLGHLVKKAKNFNNSDNLIYTKIGGQLYNKTFIYAQNAFDLSQLLSITASVDFCRDNMTKTQFMADIQLHMWSETEGFSFVFRAPKLGFATVQTNDDNSHNAVVSLTRGKLVLDYNFKGELALGNVYLASSINWIILIFAVVLIFSILGKAVWGLIGRIYQITLLYLMMPIVASTLPIDEKGTRFENWKSKMITEVLSTYGVVIGLNFFFILIPVIRQSSQIFTDTDIANMTSTMKIFAGSADRLNYLCYILFLLVAFTLLKTVPSLVQEFTGYKNNVIDTGKSLKDNTIKTVQEASKTTSDLVTGRALVDTYHKTTDTIFGKKDKEGNRQGGLVRDFIPGKAIYDEFMKKRKPKHNKEDVSPPIESAPANQPAPNVANPENQPENANGEATTTQSNTQTRRPAIDLIDIHHNNDSQSTGATGDSNSDSTAHDYVQEAKDAKYQEQFIKSSLGKAQDKVDLIKTMMKYGEVDRSWKLTKDDIIKWNKVHGDQYKIVTEKIKRSDFANAEDFRNARTKQYELKIRAKQEKYLERAENTLKDEIEGISHGAGATLKRNILGGSKTWAERKRDNEKLDDAQRYLEFSKSKLDESKLVGKKLKKQLGELSIDGITDNTDADKIYAKLLGMKYGKKSKTIYDNIVKEQLAKGATSLDAKKDGLKAMRDSMKLDAANAIKRAEERVQRAEKSLAKVENENTKDKKGVLYNGANWINTNVVKPAIAKAAIPAKLVAQKGDTFLHGYSQAEKTAAQNILDKQKAYQVELDKRRKATKELSKSTKTSGSSPEMQAKLVKAQEAEKQARKELLLFNNENKATIKKAQEMTDGKSLSSIGLAGEFARAGNAISNSRVVKFAAKVPNKLKDGALTVKDKVGSIKDGIVSGMTTASDTVKNTVAKGATDVTNFAKKVSGYDAVKAWKQDKQTAKQNVQEYTKVNKEQINEQMRKRDKSVYDNIGKSLSSKEGTLKREISGKLEKEIKAMKSKKSASSQIKAAEMENLLNKFKNGTLSEAEKARIDKYINSSNAVKKARLDDVQKNIRKNSVKSLDNSTKDKLIKELEQKTKLAYQNMLKKELQNAGISKSEIDKLINQNKKDTAQQMYRQTRNEIKKLTAEKQTQMSKIMANGGTDAKLMSEIKKLNSLIGQMQSQDTQYKREIRKLQESDSKLKRQLSNKKSADALESSIKSQTNNPFTGGGSGK